MPDTKISADPAAAPIAGTEKVPMVQSAANVAATPQQLAGYASHRFEGRLTLVSGTPVSRADVTGATTIYCTPYLGNKATLWDGAQWLTVEFAEISRALGVLVSDTNYDIYLFLSAGAVTIDSFVAWVNSGMAITGATNASPIVITANGHGLSNGDEAYISALQGNTAANGTWTVANVTANTFELSGSSGNGVYVSSTGLLNARVGTTKPSLQDGRYCKTGDKTRLYVGTLRTTGTTTTEDSAGGVASQTGGKRFLWNYYNRCTRAAGVIDTTTSWTYTTGAWRAANNASANRVAFVVGIGDEYVDASLSCEVALASNSNGTSAAVAAAFDSTSIATGISAGGYNSNVGTMRYPLFSNATRAPCAGYHYFAWLEYGTLGTCAFIGNNVTEQAGMTAYLRS